MKLRLVGRVLCSDAWPATPFFSATQSRILLLPSTSKSTSFRFQHRSICQQLVLSSWSSTSGWVLKVPSLRARDSRNFPPYHLLQGSSNLRTQEAAATEVSATAPKRIRFAISFAGQSDHKINAEPTAMELNLFSLALGDAHLLWSCSSSTKNRLKMI
jgi:hypothetical protein